MNSIPGFLDFRETYDRQGHVTAVLLGLPKGHTCRIVQQGGPLPFVRITQNGSRHGRRYSPNATYDAALAESIKWGRRKLAEAKRAAK